MFPRGRYLGCASNQAISPEYWTDSRLRLEAPFDDNEPMNMFPSRLISSLASVILASSLLTTPPKSFAEIAVKSGEKIAFLGDSITAAGWGNPAGYVRLVMAGLEANGVKAEAIPAGISGHKSDQMLARLEKDVLQKKPQWMTLSCGVNDVWHGKNGVPLDDSEAAAKALGIEGPADAGTGHLQEKHHANRGEGHGALARK